MAHSDKKQWETPAVGGLETPEEVLEHYGPKASLAERPKLEEIVARMREARRSTSAAPKVRRSGTE